MDWQTTKFNFSVRFCLIWLTKWSNENLFTSKHTSIGSLSAFWLFYIHCVSCFFFVDIARLLLLLYSVCFVQCTTVETYRLLSEESVGKNRIHQIEIPWNNTQIFNQNHYSNNDRIFFIRFGNKLIKACKRA